MNSEPTCPQCRGSRVQWVGGIPLACHRCNSPGWDDPETALLRLCRCCLGSGEVVAVDEERRALVQAACPVCAHSQ